MTSTLYALLLAGLLAAGTAHAQNTPVKVNGVTISQQRMDFFVKNLVAQGRPDTPELRSSVREHLINQELLAQEAKRRGLDKNTEVAMQLEIARQSVLSDSLMRDVMRGNLTVNDDAVRKEYERLKAQLGTREFRARHILVDKEDEAKEIIAQIKKGASFEKLAAERSKDSGSKVRGGELDWSPAGQYVKPFADALNRLKKGQMTDSPVQTNFGWHVIRVEDERPAKVPAYDQVKGNLQQQMQLQTQKQAFEKTITELRAKAKIE
ncbi:MAG TPA: peptidylprolyl isomerase [Burkholderiales bacterium]|nr:peptidylprolyl isomerase [Burkholderiales bacterium]